MPNPHNDAVTSCSTQTARRRLRVFPVLALFVALTGCAVAPPVVPLSGVTETTTSGPSVAEVTATSRPTDAPTNTASPTLTTTSTSPPAVTITSTSTVEPSPIAPLPTPTLPALDEARRGELFEKVWSTVAAHYLYTDFGGVDWNELKETYRPRAIAAPTPEAFYATLSDMIGRLEDRHSRFEDPQDAFVQQALASGKDAYVGIGVLTVKVEDALRITTVFPNSPAAEAQVERRDMIVAVDGAPVNVDDPGIGGPEGSYVELTLRGPEGEERTVSLRRRAVVAQYVPEAYVLPGTKIGYVLIQSFWAQDMAEKTTAAIERMLEQNGGAVDGLLIDLRSNGGGWRNVLEGLLGNFVQGEVGAFYSQATSYPFSITAGPLYDRLKDVPVVVLVDRESESYTEVFAAVLQAQGRAEVVGETTAGNTETIFAYDFDDGSRLWVAQEGFRLPDGSNLEGRGVAPDRTISVDWTQFSELRDPHIVAALDVIQQRQAGAK